MFNATKLVVFNELLFGSSSDSDDELNFFETKHQVDAFCSSCSSSSEDSNMEEQDGHHDLDSFMHKIDAYNDQQFNSQFRLRRSTIDFLISLYGKSDEVILPDSVGAAIDFRKDIYIYLWYITHFIGYKELGALFGTTRASSEAAVRRVCHWIISIAHEHLKWPLGQDVKETSRKFEQFARIPGVIGAIDCTHITVKPPKVNKHWYYNRQHSYSIVLQAVVDADKKFIDVCVGEPGSQRDSTVLRKSELHERARDNFSDTFPGESFLLGDLAYAPSSWIIPPYSESPHLIDAQRNFNRIHYATRIVVEDALELLKGRFQRLSMFTEETNLCAVTNLVASTCVLHNICIEKQDIYGDGLTKFYDDDSDDDEYNVENSVADPPLNRRRKLFRYLVAKEII